MPTRLVEPVYPIVYLDALVVKVRAGHQLGNPAVQIALAAVRTFLAASSATLGHFVAGPGPQQRGIRHNESRGSHQ